MLKSARVNLALWNGLALVVALATGAALTLSVLAPTDTGLPFSPAWLKTTAALLSVLLLLLYALRVRRIATLLNGLEAIRHHCGKIHINSLNERLQLDQPITELHSVAAEYNGMLSQLEQAVKRIRQFSGDASHELRTPLTILRGETEVALRWGKTVEEFRDTLGSNMEEIDRMGRIIEDLLTLAKSESGELPLSIGYLSLSDLLQELYLQGRKLAEKKQIQVDLHHQEQGEIWIRGDDLRLRQLFLNLLTNAIRYTPDGGQVDIDVTCSENQAIVQIRDTGIGIAAEHLPHIFERFYRTDEARNRIDGGTGLGLAIVKWVTEAHQGTIHVQSTPGEGSTFEIRLPYRRRPPAEPPQEAAVPDV
ncbi:MAG: two-component sensor histidine kinase [Desulfuromonadaceae bacterium]|nr:two-component sensor histidine kinase [Desulfuromonadaceae bacterium]